MKEIIGGVAVIVAILTYLPYLRDTIKGTIKPHPFSWFIWVTVTAVVYIAQFSDNAGPGAWMNGVVVFICLFVVLFSVKNGFDDITRFDQILFGLAIASIPLWIVTNDPTWSVILLSLTNTIAYIPTFRKSYTKPYDEALYLYSINFFRHGVSVFALANFSVITALFPIVLTVNNLALALFLFWRRRKI